MKDVYIDSDSKPSLRANQNGESNSSRHRDLDLELVDNHKENNSKHHRKASFDQLDDCVHVPLKENLNKINSMHIRDVATNMASPQIQLLQYHGQNPSKLGIVQRSPEHCESSISKHSLSIKITSSVSRSQTKTNNTSNSSIFGTIALKSLSTGTRSVNSTKPSQNEYDILLGKTPKLRRSSCLKRWPMSSDKEYSGLESLEHSKLFFETMDINDALQERSTPLRELELILKTDFASLPFCDPLSAFFSCGSIGDSKVNPSNASEETIPRARIFAPEGVFSIPKLPTGLSLDNHELERKNPKSTTFSSAVYEGTRIAEMTLPEYCRMLRNIAHGSSESADQAHSILRETIQQYRDCIGVLRPNGACFNAVIHGYAQLGYAAAAENVLSLMFQEYIDNNDLAKPNVRVYTNVLHAWRKSKSLDAHVRCETILDEMQRLSDNSIVPECKPDTYAYTVLFHCLAESDCSDASEIAERQYQKIKNGSERIHLDAIAYSNLLNIFTKNPSTHERAEKLLWEMVADYEAGNQKAKPHTRNFNTVLAMWAKSTIHDSAGRAQGVVESLIKLQERGVIDARPDEYTYSLLLKSWVSRGPSGIDHALNCLMWMEQRYEHGDRAAKLDTIKYTTCISALAREGFSHRAETLLKKMEIDHRRGNKQARPDVKNFETVINSWSGFYGVGHNVDESRAEKVLRMMWTLGEEPVFVHIRPGVQAYVRVVEAMAKRCDPECSETLLNEMIDLHKIGRLPSGPDQHTFQVVIDAWSKSDKNDRYVRAGQLRTRMNRQLGMGT